MIKLVHLTLTGEGKEPAAIEFGPRLTVIYGASDTGKTYIYDAINYVLGGSKLRKIIEAKDYTHILLGIERANGDLFTMVRKTSGGGISIYYGDLREVPDWPADVRLTTKHDSEKAGNVSRFLLQEVGLDECFVRTNQSNKTRMMSFREVSKLFMIDETSMQAPRSPVLASGQAVNKTLEKSIFRFLIDNQDDSALISHASTADRGIIRAKAEVLDQLIGDLESQVEQPNVEPAEIRAQSMRLKNSIDESTASIAGLISERSSIVDRENILTRSMGDQQNRLAEVSDLLARFKLLEEQYLSDLSRLEMVREAGVLLGFFDTGVCAFCGAEPEHQHSSHVEQETTRLAQGVEAEHRKISTLLVDLRVTISDLQDQHTEMEDSIEEIRSRLRQTRAELSELEDSISPLRESLSELLDKKSSVERQLSIYDQIKRMKEVKGEVGEVVVDEVEEVRDEPLASNIRKFERVARDVLASWGISGASGAVYDNSDWDLVVDGRLREDRGKGMRAILHAAFTISLAKYRYEQQWNYPSFVILDSPVVTYREPGTVQNPEEEAVTRSVADRFYQYLGSEFEAQAIVMENVDPPSGSPGSSVNYFFTNNREIGRSGFFPA